MCFAFLSILVGHFMDLLCLGIHTDHSMSVVMDKDTFSSRRPFIITLIYIAQFIVMKCVFLTKNDNYNISSKPNMRLFEINNEVCKANKRPAKSCSEYLKKLFFHYTPMMEHLTAEVCLLLITLQLL